MGCKLWRMLSPVKLPKALNPAKHCTFDSGIDLCILLLLTHIGCTLYSSNKEQILKVENFWQLISACEPLHLFRQKQKTASKIYKQPLK